MAGYLSSFLPEDGINEQPRLSRLNEAPVMSYLNQVPQMGESSYLTPVPQMAAQEPPPVQMPAAAPQFGGYNQTSAIPSNMELAPTQSGNTDEEAPSTIEAVQAKMAAMMAREQDRSLLAGEMGKGVDAPTNLGNGTDMYGRALKPGETMANNTNGAFSKLDMLDLSNPNVDMDWIQGYRLAQEDAMKRRAESREEAQNRRADNADRRAEGDYSMRRVEHFNKQEVLLGMRDAAEKGGYSGVIDYLSVVDPSQALKVHQEKIALDGAIMKNDVMKATVPAEKAKAMAEGYGALGKMFQGIMNAPEQDRADMYKTILPMIKTINPSAPNEYGAKAAGMFMLAQAQATPENVLFNQQRNLGLFQDELGKTSMSLAELERKGLQNTPLYKNYQNKLIGLQANDLKAQMGLQQAQLDIMKKQAAINGGGSMGAPERLKAAQTMAKNIQTASKSNIEAFDAIKNINENLRIVDESGGADSPKAAQALSQIQQFLTRMTQGSRPSDKDVERAQAAGGFAAMSKTLMPWINGGMKQALNQEEVNQLKYIITAYRDRTMEAQKTIENSYKSMAEMTVKQMTGEDAQGNPMYEERPIVDINKLPLPSKTYEAILFPRAAATASSESEQRQIAAAKQRGWTDEQIQRQLAAYRAQQGQ